MQTIRPVHSCDHPTAEALYPFDARGVAKRFRHAAIFGALDSLMPGETMRFCNDHDPLPLLAQLQQRYGQHLSIVRAVAASFDQEQHHVHIGQRGLHQIGRAHV